MLENVKFGGTGRNGPTLPFTDQNEIVDRTAFCVYYPYSNSYKVFLGRSSHVPMDYSCFEGWSLPAAGGVVTIPTAVELVTSPTFIRFDPNNLNHVLTSIVYHMYVVSMCSGYFQHQESCPTHLLTFRRSKSWSATFATAPSSLPPARINVRRRAVRITWRVMSV